MKITIYVETCIHKTVKRATECESSIRTIENVYFANGMSKESTEHRSSSSRHVVYEYDVYVVKICEEYHILYSCFNSF